MNIGILDNVVDLYIRVSTTEQADEGYSVGEQEAKLRAYCQAYNYSIHAVHIDPGFSGGNLDRPGIKNVIEDVNNGRCKKVIVWKLDRLSRSQKDTLILLEDVFLEHDCAFVSLMESFDTGTPFGRCIVGILAAFAQMERENIRIRTMMGRQARIRLGHFHGSHAPIGYKFELAPDGKPLSNDIVLDLYVSKLVKEVFRRFLSGQSLTAIGREMEAMYGNTEYDWNNNTAIRRIITNPVYMGKVKVGNDLYDGIHEPLVSETDWYMAAAILENNKELNKRSYSFKTASGQLADNLLTGLLFCGDCGARMYARKVSASKKKYICHSVARTSPAMIKSDHCTNRVHPYTVSELDNIIVEEIRKLSLSREYFDSISTPEPQEDTTLYEERIAEIKKQTDRLLNLYQTGLISINDIQSRLGELQHEKETLEEKLRNIDVVSSEEREYAWGKICELSAAIESGSKEDLHHIIHTLIDKVEVLNYDITIYWSFS